MMDLATSQRPISIQKRALLFFVLVGLNWLLFGQEISNQEDLRIIRQAINREGGEKPKVWTEPKWLKIWIKEESIKAKEIKLNLPVVLVDFLILISDAKNKNNLFYKTELEQKQLDDRWKLSALWQELKRLGPGYRLKLKDKSAFIQIWLE
ncbi:MAG: hypothetical protein N3B16_12980 [Candidatus Aminicenantes bacterium]|nr:hypothetical protein [Candidatus Aminicenantes bacterium]